MAGRRDDFAVPLRIDLGSGLGQRVDYAAHVKQMVVQLLLTAPGERANRPDFGCGLRALIFAANSPALATTAEILVRGALNRWLSSHLMVKRVTVQPPELGTITENRIEVLVEYELLVDRSDQRVNVRVGS